MEDNGNSTSAPANGTPTIQLRRLNAASSESDAAIDLAGDCAKRDAEYAAKEAERQEQEETRWRNQTWGRLLSEAGKRYADCRFSNYEATTPQQRDVLANLRDFAENIVDNVEAGRNVILFGSCGTGKDHLLVSMAHIAIGRLSAEKFKPRYDAYEDRAPSILWTNGTNFFADVRDAITLNITEEKVTRRLARADVLILSDPVPPAGSITPYQASVLLNVVDARYRNVLPTWVSMNVASGAEADEKLGAQIVDRLKHGALCLYCSWPSYRKPLGKGDE